jgi:membrane-bound serine protease (ClpP class)
MVAPGVIGAICLLVGLFALNTLPLNYAGLALLLLGIAFMTVEAFMPSFGVLGIGGAIAFVIGAIMMFDVDGMPAFEVAPGVAIGAGIASAAFFVLVLGAAVRARKRAVVTGAEELVGSIGQVTRAGAAQGWVRLHGEEWQARSTSGPLQLGERVRVTGRDGLTLLVDSVNEPGRM